MSAASSRQKKQKRKLSTMQAARDADEALNQMAAAHERIIAVMQYTFTRLSEFEEKGKEAKKNERKSVELPEKHTFGQFVIPEGSRLSRWD